jgi:hypothetical protein
MDAAAMSYTYVGRIYDLHICPGFAKWNLRIFISHPSAPTTVTMRLKTTSTVVLNQLHVIPSGTLIEVSATPSPASAPGEPYIATRLTVLSTTPAEP